MCSYIDYLLVHFVSVLIWLWSDKSGVVQQFLLGRTNTIQMHVFFFRIQGNMCVVLLIRLICKISNSYENIVSLNIFQMSVHVGPSSSLPFFVCQYFSVDSVDFLKGQTQSEVISLTMTPRNINTSPFQSIFSSDMWEPMQMKSLVHWKDPNSELRFDRFNF